ncbi:hypothetical protein DQW77_05385 [Roseovarius sp. TE539]|uniref:putative rhamnosyl transferase n=1 Tax=Roseovarius sp. TE539 TaxID=2249812 RepID=UPI000DDF0108|nr:putative rhamnosyl transferase [Roseovarius sp. TE539]RBI75795.1 hypothetical protein DQW77_05385 [Roseovarius sp. TE539]
MNSRNMQVIGLCRFSYPAIGGFQVEHASVPEREAYLYAPERMEERFRTFESFTLPPLRAQTDPDFTFLVIIGKSLPDPYRQRLAALLANLPQAVIQEHEPGRHRDVMKAAINAVRETSDLPSLQFRMDDDDAVSVNFVERLREAANDIRPLIRRNRYVGIDFNQGFVARPGADGVGVRAVVETLWTPALAVAVKPRASRGVMNFSHAKLCRSMPVLSLTGEFMFVRGHNEFNDSRQTRDLKPPRVSLLDKGGEAYFKENFNIDAAHVRALYAT